jgi:CMP-N,N'-diacetyllegionaminic acid synthase
LDEACGMIGKKKVLGLIPARGGSKGIPNKNIRSLLGKPLITWTIEQANASQYLDTVLVSTDSREIASIATQSGASVPFLRPSELAQDESPTVDAVIHAIRQLMAVGKQFDYVVLLEPTSPLRKKDDIDNAIELLNIQGEADGLVSVGEIHTEHPLIVKSIHEDGYVTSYLPGVRKIYQRQQTDRAYFPYGVVYISKVTKILDKRSFYSKRTIPYLIERWQNYEIDDEVDFSIIEQLAKQKLR